MTVSADWTKTGVIFGSSTGAASFSSLTVTGLTAGRVPYIGTGGLFSNEAALAYDAATDTLTCGTLSLGGNVTLGTEGAGVAQLGADSATPVAQLWKSCDGVGANIAGAALTVAGGRGTGSAVGGSVIFQTSAAGDAGSGANALATRLTVSSTTITATLPVLTGDGTVGAPAWAFSGTPTKGIYNRSAGYFDIADGGASIVTMGGAGFTIQAGCLFGWSSSTPDVAGADLVLARDAAATLALRNGVNAQTFNWYATYASATDYHRGVLGTAKTTVTCTAAQASVTATGLIPDGAVLIGLTTKVTTGIGNSNGTTGYTVGDGVDADRWGAIVGIAAGTSSQNTNWTATTVQAFTAAQDVVITATGGNFDGTGVIAISAMYLIGQCD